MMIDWHDRSIKSLQLAGLSERTQECYPRGLRMLCEFYDKTPDLVTEQERQDYFLHRRNVDKWSPATMRICYCGIRAFFINVLERQWHTFHYLKAQRERKLPAVLSREEVRCLLSLTHTIHNRVFLSTVYACGLRLQEGLFLQVSDIDSDRMMIHVHRGKGAKDRFVPLPHSTLKSLRSYWKTYRHPQLLFSAVGRGFSATTADSPIAKSSVQGAFRGAKTKANITKRGVSVHILRHTYATHLLEEGVNIRVIQRSMGHANLETTMVYLHLTRKGQEDAYKLIDSLMGDL